jgi:uncharacterized protein
MASRQARAMLPKLSSCLLACCSLAVAAEITPETLLLKDYRPRSIFKLPETRVERARYPAIDVHAHVYATTEPEIQRWIAAMDEVGVEKTIILAGSTGPAFDRVMALYAPYSERFEVWCGLDLGGFDQPGFGPAAIAELERCHRLGAKGIGELSDKGRGLRGAPGLHGDDPRLDPIFQRCGELGMPINIHVAEDRWMYEPMDRHNDGLMNAWKWRIPDEPGVLRHHELMATLERMLQKHPGTTFIACHLANLCSDLDQLGGMFDRYPNLYADIGARFAELSPIPRMVHRFFTKYQDRILYGTDSRPHPEMYRTTFRILETDDEHFYPAFFVKYHWPMHGFALPDEVLKKLYRDNALEMRRRATQR